MSRSLGFPGLLKHFELLPHHIFELESVFKFQPLFSKLVKAQDLQSFPSKLWTLGCSVVRSHLVSLLFLVPPGFCKPRLLIKTIETFGVSSKQEWKQEQVRFFFFIMTILLWRFIIMERLLWVMVFHLSSKWEMCKARGNVSEPVFQYSHTPSPWVEY